MCTYCGAFSRRYRQTHGEEEDEALRKAIESKVREWRWNDGQNRLLQYDRENTARSQV